MKIDVRITDAPPEVDKKALRAILNREVQLLGAAVIRRAYLDRAMARDRARP